MLSAPALRTHSSQPPTHPLKTSHTPSPASPLSLSSTRDIVTNPDRAKSPYIQRVLSPVRARRTPVLINAPDIKWRFAASPHLRGVPSLDSVWSDGTVGSAGTAANGAESVASGTSVGTIRPYHLGTRDGSLMAESANSSSSSGSTRTAVPETLAPSVYVSSPTIPSSPVSQQSRVLRDGENNGIEASSVELGRRKAEEQYECVYRSHPPSLVLEASPTPSHASSMRSGSVSGSEPTEAAMDRQHNYGNGGTRSAVGVQNREVAGEAAETYTAGHMAGEAWRENTTADFNHQIAQKLDQDASGNTSTLHGRFTRLKKRIKHKGNRAVERVARKLAARALARVL
ncbi:hypothetical protein SVAN01_08648 [Stagonosporopsis vannaccii]|nr:hypothetical protein SVAN01_08648 [Stagonosporopsis vannaccii]